MTTAPEVMTSPPLPPLPRHQRLGLRLGQAALLAATLWLIFDQANRLDLGVLANQWPRDPAFYVVFIVWYLLLPCADTFVHTRFWRVGFWRLLPTLTLKRVYNAVALGYSGDAYVLARARTHFGVSLRSAFSLIKDSAILSALASHVVTIATLIWLLADPRSAEWIQAIPYGDEGIWALIAFCAALIAATILLRRQAMALQGPEIGWVLGVHGVRLLATLLLQILLWWMLTPGVALSVWAWLMGLYLIVSRFPFLPNRDLVFTAIVLAVSSSLHADAAAIQAAVLIVAALTQVAHALAFFGATALSAAAR